MKIILVILVAAGVVSGIYTLDRCNTREREQHVNDLIEIAADYGFNAAMAGLTRNEMNRRLRVAVMEVPHANHP